jgi:predicted unusual protein kinase regulating ubiquinone biosynthesis (AarF/ABC1/UbiB family)
MQIHKAVALVGGQRMSVAVKVCHPYVAERISMDFVVLKALARMASK